MKRTLLLFVICSIAISLDAQISKKIDVGGHKIDVKIKQGGPVPVIFEAGLLQDLSTWDPVFNIVGSFTTAVAYSRAGYGESEDGPLPRTPSNILKDFTVLLDNLDLKQPIILVGHSWGGLLARYYTANIPERIGGLVLVDATHGAEGQVMMSQDSIVAEFLRQGYMSFKDSSIKANAFSKSVFSEWDVTDKIQETGGADFEPIILPDIPIVVITAQGGPLWPKGLKNTKRITQGEWIEYSSNAMWIITDKSGHDVMVDQPNLIVEGITYINKILLAEQIKGN